MSKAFTKEDDDSAETLPDLPQSPHPNYVTPEGPSRYLHTWREKRNQKKSTYYPKAGHRPK
jgi:hypothetical protein